MAKTNTIVTMVTGQANTGRKVEGLIAENKVDANKKYVLTKFDAETGEIEFTEQLPEDAPESAVAKVVKITKENAAVMRYVMNPNEKPCPEAKLETIKGQQYLVIGDNEIFLGTIAAIKVVAGYTGEVILGVEASDENYMGLLRYDVQFDKFDAEPFATVSRAAKVIVLDSKTYIFDNIIIDVAQVDDKGNPILDAAGNPVTKPRLADASLYQYSGRGYLSRMYAGEYHDYDYDEDEDDYDYDDYDDDNNDGSFDAPIDSIRLVEQGDRKDLAIVFVKETDDDGYLVDKAGATIKLYRANDFTRVGTFDVSDAEAKVYLGGSFKKAPVVTVKDSNQILIRDAYGLKVVNNAAVVTAMDGFNYFCGTEVKKDDDDRDTVIFTYANKDMAVKSFSMTKTDRGTLFALV